ncbi:MAG: hypothetical protein C0404_00715 [Verrucomicrobia bacterium]|nr:hypothetical protein [Verrucomicrobiota bacterium]
MTPNWEHLYLLQDWVLNEMKLVKHEFYLTGGTALSRGYYGHRYSEDLDIVPGRVLFYCILTPSR